MEKPDNKAYFWADGPCFSCMRVDSCEPVKTLTSEFKELKVYGFQ
ncbi:MAG: hypothetical protein ACFFDN_52100 [Candidatus Hodarchaeota archaeon]